MAQNQAWISMVKSEFEKSPLVSNVFFGFVLLGLEKLVEVEFACPCNPKWNGLFAVAFFIVPAVLVFLLMINIQGCKPKISKTCGEKVFFSAVPAIVWSLLMFLDGQYYACAKTNWSGRYVIVDEAAPQKWCEPDNHNSSLKLRTQEWFTESQVIGMGHIILFTLGLGVYLIYKCNKREGQLQEEHVQGRDHQDPEAPVPTNNHNKDDSLDEATNSGDLPLKETK